MNNTQWIRICLLFVGMTLATNSMAQTYEGRVVNEKGAPIGAASVLLLNERLRTTAFGKTRSDGTFRVATPEGKTTSHLVFSCLNYRRDTVAIKNFQQGQTITMEEQATEIRNVDVKAARIRQEGDTLNYLVNSFRQKQDRTIADVLRKMPGIDVDKNGTISYQGTKINRLYVEGMDLMGGKYTQVTENLSADKVKKVQVMENHQPVKMLRNVVFSEQAALNIVLTDDARNVWQGDMDVATGATLQDEKQWLGSTKWTEMMFSRKMQSVSMYKYDNTGKDIAQEVNPIAMLEEGAPKEPAMVNGNNITTPALDDKRTLFNDAHVVATNWLFKPTKDTDLRIQLDGKTDLRKWGQHKETWYADIDNGVMTIDETATRTRETSYAAEASYRLNGAKAYIENTTKGNISINNSHGNTTWMQSPIKLDAHCHQYHLTDFLRMERRLSHGRTISVKGYLSLNSLPSKLLLTNGTMQQMDATAWMAGANGAFSHKMGLLRWTHTLDYKTKSQHTTLDGNTTERGFRYGTNQIKAASSATIRYKNVELKADAGLTWMQQSLDGKHRTDEGLQLNTRAYWTPSQHWQLTASYQQSLAALDGWSTTDMGYYSNYYVMTQGRGTLTTFTTQRASVNIAYKDIIRGLFSSATISWNHANHQQLYRHLLNRNGYLSIATNEEADREGWNIYSRASKTLRWAHMFIGLAWHLNSHMGTLLIDNQQAKNTNTTMTTSLQLSLQPCDWLSMKANSYWIQTMQQQHIGNGQRTTQNSFAHDMKIYVMPGKWQIEWAHEIYHSNDGSLAFNYFSDISCCYREKTWEVGLTLNNIYGRATYQWHRFRDNQQYLIINKLRPREALVGVKFSL